jgi:hypothetical protein
MMDPQETAAVISGSVAPVVAPAGTAGARSKLGTRPHCPGPPPEAER